MTTFAVSMEPCKDMGRQANVESPAASHRWGILIRKQDVDSCRQEIKCERVWESEISDKQNKINK